MDVLSKKVAIVDYNIGNLFSVRRACDKIGLNAFITSKKKEIEDADALILPGVGAFGVAMSNLKKNGLIDSIYKFADSGKHIMGVCLGMQLLMDKSEEFGAQQGLGLISGSCKIFPSSKMKVPQITWNNIYAPNNSQHFSDASPLSSLNNNVFMYFVHSFYVIPEEKNNILSLTKIDNFEYCSSVIKDNIYGFQFHPEKSGQVGLDIYNNFKKIIDNG